MAKLSPRAASVVAAGEAAFGSRWQSPLARAADIPQSLLAMIHGGTREPSDEAYRKVAIALMREAERVRAVANKLDLMAERMLRKLEE